MPVIIEFSRCIDTYSSAKFESVDLFYKQLPSRKLWNGYHLFAIDGSKIELPNSKSNFEFFGEMFGYPDPSRRFTMGLGSFVYDVLDDYIVHASFTEFLKAINSNGGLDEYCCLPVQ